MAQLVLQQEQQEQLQQEQHQLVVQLQLEFQQLEFQEQSQQQEFQQLELLQQVFRHMQLMLMLVMQLIERNVSFFYPYDDELKLNQLRRTTLVQPSV
jgi:hypothetical protein